MKSGVERVSFTILNPMPILLHTTPLIFQAYTTDIGCMYNPYEGFTVRFDSDMLRSHQADKSLTGSLTGLVNFLETRMVKFYNSIDQLY
jgi:hypothetical protein